MIYYAMILSKIVIDSINGTTERENEETSNQVIKNFRLAIHMGAGGALEILYNLHGVFWDRRRRFICQHHI